MPSPQIRTACCTRLVQCNWHPALFFDRQYANQRRCNDTGANQPKERWARPRGQTQTLPTTTCMTITHPLKPLGTPLPSGAVAPTCCCHHWSVSSACAAIAKPRGSPIVGRSPWHRQSPVWWLSVMCNLATQQRLPSMQHVHC